MAIEIENIKRKKGAVKLRKLVNFLDKYDLDILKEADLHLPKEAPKYRETFNPEAIALLVYDGGALYSILSNEFGCELSNQFYAFLEKISLNYEKCNNYSMELFDTE